MPMSPQEISKKYKRQSLGMPKASPSSSTKISGFLSKHYIFIRSRDMCYSWIVIFVFLSVLFCFLAVINGWILAFQFGERHALFSLSRTLQFSLLLFCECSVFATTAFSSCFAFLFFLELIGLLSIYMISSLVFDEYLL